MLIHRFLRPLALTGAVILAVAGCGGDDDDDVSTQSPAAGEEESGGHGDHDTMNGAPTDEAKDVPARTVEIEMKDALVYNPDTLAVQGGETIKFVFKNTGQLPHDALIGDAHIQDEHEAGGAADHDNHHAGQKPPFVTVAPGQTGELTYKFTTPGEVLIGCHQAGHWVAGMKLPITVS